MGTTLTGTTPASTYDSLIKVTDNGPLSGTAKYLSDGLGNDSVLALSTSAVGVSETSPLGKLHIKTADTSVSSVSAQGNLLVLEDAENGLSILSSTAGAGYILFGDSNDNDVAGIIYDHSANAMIFNTNAAERIRITSAGYVGIGTSTPADKLTVSSGGYVTSSIISTGNSSRAYLTSSAKDAGGNEIGGLFGSLFDADAVELRSYTNHPLIIKTNNTERMRITSAGIVGIGTSSPNANLEVSRSTQQTDIGAAGQVVALLNTSADIANNATGIRFRQDNGTNNCNSFIGTLSSGSSTNRSSLVFAPSNSSGDAVEVMRMTPSGNVGIGTTTPSTKLEVVDANSIAIRIGDVSAAPASQSAAYVGVSTSGFTGANGDLVLIPRTSDARNVIFYTGSGTPAERFRVTDNGVTFNGDTAAANALDDYEEGTWTMGVSFGGASVGVTYGSNSGAYTKVGRQVTVTGYLALSNKGSSTGAARITGLPFTIGNGNQFQSVGSMRTENITFADVIQCNSVSNETKLDLTETTNAGVISQIFDTDFSNNSVIFLHFTYFV